MCGHQSLHCNIMGVSLGNDAHHRPVQKYETIKKIKEGEDVVIN